MLDLLNGYGAAASITARDIRPKRLGTLGEQAVIAHLVRAGRWAVKPDDHHSGDVVAWQGVPFQRTSYEVKTALQGKSGTFQFCLKRSVGTRVCTDCHYADVVILLAVDDQFRAVMFVIPTSEIGAQKKINISNPANPNGKYAKYIRSVL